MNGVVKRIPVDEVGKRRGFGFLVGDDDGVDRFFHATGVDRMSGGFDRLQVGTRVRFEAIDGPKGPRAVDVCPV